MPILRRWPVCYDITAAAILFWLLALGVPVPSGGSEQQDLVLGAEYNIREEELRIFLASLRSSGCTAQVVLFCGRPQEHTTRLARRYGATLVQYDFEALNQTHGPVGVHRFHLYRRFLEERLEQYRLVLHTDVRDVMFQDDPFSRIEAHGGGVFFLESNHLLIGTSPTNRGWLTENCTVYWSEDALGRIGGRLRSCSGNFFGSSHAAYWYSRLMEQEQQRTADALRAPDGSITGRGWCADQAVHQTLLWTGAFSRAMHNVTTYRNEDGPLCTMGDVVKIYVDEYGEVRNNQGELYAVVHQYDRHHRVKDIIAARYDEDETGKVHPAFVEGYKEHVLWGNPSRITHHHHADTSLPPPNPAPPPTPPPPEQCQQAQCREQAGSGGREEEAEEEDEERLRERWEGVLARAPPEEALHVHAIRDIVTSRAEYPRGRYGGRGVVTAAGGQLQVANAFAALSSLRQLGCTLPVELFYAGPDEMSAEAVEVMAGLNVTCLDIYHSPGVPVDMPLRGWQLKAFAVVHASFEELLWLDADSVPAQNPEFLFDGEVMGRFGSHFWPDWSTDPHWLTPSFFTAYGLEMKEGERELEAGQFLLLKPRCWVALQVVLYLNTHFRHFYRRMYGDKDTWRLAFRLARTPIGLNPLPADLLGRRDPSGVFCGSAMAHVTPAGADAFYHRTLQTLPSHPTPPLHPLLDDQILREVADKWEPTWTLRTRGGLQRLVPRLKEWEAGWRVEQRDADVYAPLHRHWCAFLDHDWEVELEEVGPGSGVRQAEERLVRALSPLAAAAVIATLPAPTHS